MPFAPEAHLSGIEKIRKRKRDIIMRSDSVKTGTAQAPHRSLFNALGFTEEERRRPMIGIVSSFNEIVPGHMNLDKITEAVKGGVVAFVDEVRAFIPASQLSAEYVEKLEDWQGKSIETVIITVDPEKKRLVLSGREVEKEKKAEARKERLAQFKAGDVVEGTVDSIKDYGAFVKLADGIDGLVHISQISTQRIKHPGAVLKEGQTVKVKILSIADGKISLSMKALIQQETEEEEHETFDYKETASATTGLGDLLKGLKL